MEPIKVLIIDDSAFMRKMLSDILNRDRRIQVIGTARNGEDGLQKAANLDPDVITLDVEMPKMDGLTALENLMKIKPIPVVMVSSVTSEGTDSTIKAMTLGAVDFISKPSGSISLDIHKVGHSIVRKVLTASKAKVTMKSHKVQKQVSDRGTLTAAKAFNHPNKIVAIGTSTGGPRALQTVLTSLPEGVNWPIVIVQHMPKGFTKSLAKRLHFLSKIIVKEAEDGEVLQKGTAYIAPGDEHLGIEQRNGDLVIHLKQSEPIQGHRPSVNYLFQSLSQLKISTLAIVMTGMGADGTEGLIQLKKRNTDTYVIAESEETSIVFGMPKAVIKSKLADEVIPVDKISERIGDL
ncbi:chemotaxis response regulator protein-glutamate methylesterase [Halobacillus andaensis]|uniref:Protein-glutamate methylesterase/protein-glutamine glutaminase n=1 Tax=Halobacillus andaensis TaxID=1176239 RepID=A0A917AZM0_HALAA|nr:chemotaxis response regulator protein-glutamate methylesterase [Halobacillus andaensis]MBP2003475.1 two-component system chemotaxis response regulator CheB [Halobacillus andaensis]GGF10905.1 chemotaxis response regulator protein-glutamate methylesterase [Halobacillus andaensis]